MSPRFDGPAGRILVDPDDLRDVATRMRGAAALLAGAGRELALSQPPAMPAGLSPLVNEAIGRANSELQELALELVREAEVLAARATWADLGGDAIAWLIPNLYYIPAHIGAPVGPGHELPPVTDEQIARSTEWAAEILDEMHESLKVVDQEAATLGFHADDALGSELLRFAEEYADEIPVTALGRLATLAGMALDTYEQGDKGNAEAPAGAGVTAGGTWAEGALGVALSEAVFGVTGVGLVGCLFVGGAGGGYIGDQVGDAGFE